MDYEQSNEQKGLEISWELAWLFTGCLEVKFVIK